MMAWYRRWPFVSGIALMVIANAVVLAGVIYNRNGEPESTLTLTQRELALPYSYWQTRENTGLALRVVWRVEPPEAREEERSRRGWYRGEAAWLDRAKLEGLGIGARARAPRNADSSSYSRGLPVDVLLVLEMNGPAYKRRLKRACEGDLDSKEAKENCRREESEASRLFIVDAGHDLSTLREEYPDRVTHAIVRGQIEAIRVSDVGTSSLIGHIRGISVDEIQVAVAMRGELGPDTEVRGNADPEKPFEATVEFGRRLEPRIVKLSSPSGE